MHTLIPSTGQLSRLVIRDSEMGTPLSLFRRLNSHPFHLGCVLRSALAAGPDGNLWFLQPDGQIGRITPKGVITRFQVPGQTAQELPILTKGPDGNLWFSAPPGKIGRITPNGSVKLLPLPAQTQVGALAAAPDSHIWFLNAGDTQSGSVWWVHIGRLTV